MVKYGILFIKLDLLKLKESDIESFPSVVLITNEIFLLFNFFAFSNGLSNAPVHDLVLHPRERDLIVGTHGRSVYVANIKYLQMLSEIILSKNIHVFELEKIKFSSRWGSKGWGSNFYTPEILIVSPILLSIFVTVILAAL